MRELERSGLSSGTTAAVEAVDNVKKLVKDTQKTAPSGLASGEIVVVDYLMYRGVSISMLALPCCFCNDVFLMSLYNDIM
jgi:hypothetical protein